MADRITKIIPVVETEESLINRVRLGDEGAMAAIYERFSSIVYSVALRILREPSAAEEILQEVFIDIWRNPVVSARQRGSLSAVLVLAARNRAILMLRQRKPEDKIEDEVLADRVDYKDLTVQGRALQRSPEGMKSLPVKQLQVLRLVFFDGLTLPEIAALTGDPLDAVKSHLQSAMLLLRNAASSSDTDI